MGDMDVCESTSRIQPSKPAGVSISMSHQRAERALAALVIDHGVTIRAPPDGRAS
jgi:hypothetical protein